MLNLWREEGAYEVEKMRQAWGFCAGLSVGAALALFLAPQSGKKTRDAIARRAEDCLDQAYAAGKKVRALAEDFVERAQEQVAAGINAGKLVYRRFS